MNIKQKIQEYLEEGTQGFVKWIIKPKKLMKHLVGKNDYGRLVSYFNGSGLNLPYDKAKDFIEREKPFLIPVVQSKKLRELINKERFEIVDVTKEKDKRVKDKYVVEAKEEDKVVITITTNNVAANSLMPLLKKLKTFGEDINIKVNDGDEDDAEDFAYAGKEGRIKSVKQKGMTEPMEEPKEEEPELEEPEKEELPMETPEEEM